MELFDDVPFYFQEVEKLFKSIISLSNLLGYKTKPSYGMNRGIVYVIVRFEKDQSVELFLGIVDGYVNIVCDSSDCVLSTNKPQDEGTQINVLEKIIEIL